MPEDISRWKEEVIHLNTSDLGSLHIGLEILGTTYGIDKWRVLESV